MGTGYDVEPSELRSAAKKIKDAAGDSDKVKLADVGGSSGEFGHDAAATAFSDLMTTWEKAIAEPLKGDAEGSAGKLEENATSYERAETQSGDYFTQPGFGAHSPTPGIR